MRISIVDRANVFLTSSLITVQILVAVSHTVWAHVGGPKNWGSWGPALLGWGVGDVDDPLEICFSSTCVTVPDSFILGQTVRA